MEKIKIFVSSVQKELENERIAVTELVASAPFLERNIEAILFEQLPASSSSAETAYLEALHSCQIYIGILGFEYGRLGPDGLSATHREYLEAKRMGIPTYFFIKGDSSLDSRRDNQLKDFFSAIKDEQHGHVYKRFTHYQNLKSSIQDILLNELKIRGIKSTKEESLIAEQTIEQASSFDSAIINRVSLNDLNETLCHQYVSSVLKLDNINVETERIYQTLLNRGLLWQDNESASLHPTAAGVLLFANAPDAIFPQARIAVNAFGGIERGEPIDRDDIRDPLPTAVEKAFQFLKRNMRHTTRIEGFAKVEIHEYPYEALREAVVNAVAHRDYDLKGSCIRVEKFADRIEIISPGLPPTPISLDKIQRLNYIACSRNPMLARGLSYFERIEEQGDGIRRIVNETIALGLPRPQFRFRDGHFQVTFIGPKDILKLKSQDGKPVFELTELVLSELNDTQKNIITLLLEHKNMKVPEFAEKMNISNQAVRKAMKLLVENKKIVHKEGKARDTIYSLREGLSQ